MACRRPLSVFEIFSTRAITSLPLDNIAMTEKTEKQLDDIRQLLLLLLVKIGSTSEEIGSALGIHQSRVRQLIPISKIKKLQTPFDGGAHGER